MKNSVFKKVIAAGVLAASLIPAAHATSLQAVQGDNVVFYYDTELWGVGAFSVSGNTITFNISDDFDLIAKSSSTLTNKTDSATMRKAFSALVIQAKNGYTLGPKLNFGITDASATIANGSVTNSLELGVEAGYMSGNSFLATSYLGSYSASGSAFWSGSPTGTSSFTISPQNANLLGLGVTLDSVLIQYGNGTSTSTLDKVMFGVNVSAVPEPETYAMMLAGLGLIGFAARRRKQ
ncbi:FxDxF family PEP-CTERM protein [Duganella fentianensis]|uniref:FxDxF family PEP-CTERM protein n=1 Tax=Duganella fentianensis TaxID=2692177 RepID=UPI0032B2683F